MKLNKWIAAAVVAFASAGAANATVTLLFNSPFVGGMSSNLASASGQVTNGLSYGIIVDSNNTGFLTSYGTASTAVNSTTALTTPDGSATDDVLFIAGDKTSDSSQGGVLAEADGTTLGGNGGITAIAGLTLSGTVGAGDKFEIVWFDANGRDAGVLTDASFVLPADGSTSNFDIPFAGVDPVRSATGVTFVPESSSALLGLLGVAGLLRRRRN